MVVPQQIVVIDKWASRRDVTVAESYDWTEFDALTVTVIDLTDQNRHERQAETPGDSAAG